MYHNVVMFRNSSISWLDWPPSFQVLSVTCSALGIHLSLLFTWQPSLVAWRWKIPRLSTPFGHQSARWENSSQIFPIHHNSSPFHPHPIPIPSPSHPIQAASAPSAAWPEWWTSRCPALPWEGKVATETGCHGPKRNNKWKGENPISWKFIHNWFMS